MIVGNSKRGVRRWALLFLLLLVSVPGCKGERLTEDEEAVLEAIFRSGLEMSDDPYVRAETLRVMELTGDRRLGDWADPLTRDQDRMVRLAALRKLLLAGHDQAGRRALSLFTRGNAVEQYQVLEMVLRHGDEELQATMLERARRSGSGKIRLRALEAGLMEEVERAKREGDERLGAELLPELGRFVDDEDPEIAARALRALIDAGQTERAERFIALFLDRRATLEERRDAGRILVRARVEEAREAFLEILESVGAYDGETFGIPEREVADDLVRLSVLGMSALGEPEFARLAQEYRTGSDVEETLEVLRALGPNPSPEAAVTLSTAMRDSHPEIRRSAIVLYGARPDAQASRLRGAMGRDDFEAQKTIVSIMVERFAEDWRDFLATRLRSDDAMAVEQTLEMLRTVLRNEEELAVAAALAPELERLAGSATPGDERSVRTAGLASYLLLRVSGERAAGMGIGKNSDLQTRYAYLEHLVTNAPGEEVGLMREHLYDDSFALRLMAAAGLAAAFQDQLSWSVEWANGDTQVGE